MDSNLKVEKTKGLMALLISENKDRKIAIDDVNCTRYNRRVLNSKYTAIQETIQRLKEIIE